jgi:hypothetical protein
MDKQYWKPGVEIADMTQERIRYKLFLQNSDGNLDSCSNVVIEKRKTDLKQEEIIKQIYKTYCEFRDKCLKSEVGRQMLAHVLNGVAEKKVLENIKNTVSSVVSQYEVAIRKEFAKTKEIILLSGKIYRKPDGIMIHTRILKANEKRKNGTLVFTDKVSKKRYYTEFSNYFGLDTESSEKINSFCLNQKFLPLQFFKELKNDS